MKKFSIALSPGHTATNQGASRGNITEYGLSSAIIGDLIFKLSQAGHTAHLIGSDTNANQVKQINKIGPDFGLELHFNANVNKKVNGSMCLYYPGSKRGKNLAADICGALMDLLHIKSGGIQPAHYRLDRRKPIIEIIRETACPMIVVEPLYFSNDRDFEKINIELISQAIFEGVIGYWSGKGC